MALAVCTLRCTVLYGANQSFPQCRLAVEP